MDAIDTWLRTYPESPVILDVLGTLDPAAIRARVLEVVPDAEEVFAFSASVGALFGVRRWDGSRVAVKVNTLVRDPGYFADVQRVQGALFQRGFPAPRPVSLVGTTTVDEWIDEGSFRDGHDPGVRAAMAAALARFIELATASGVRPHRPFLRPEGAVWPKPHNALFDFEATAAGAERIDEVGRRALLPRVGREVVGHTDWAASISASTTTCGSPPSTTGTSPSRRSRSSRARRRRRSPTRRSSTTLFGAGRSPRSRSRSSTTTSERAAGGSRPGSAARRRLPPST